MKTNQKCEPISVDISVYKRDQPERLTSFYPRSILVLSSLLFTWAGRMEDERKGVWGLLCYFLCTGSQVRPQPSFLNILRSTSLSMTVECT